MTALHPVRPAQPAVPISPAVPSHAAPVHAGCGLDLRASALRLRLGRTDVLAGVDVGVDAGRWLAVIGPNGAGKSSLLRVLAGLCAPDRGQVLMEGKDLRRMPPRPRARWVGFVPQTPIVPEGVTVTDYVMLGRTPFRPLLSAPRRSDREVVAEVLERLDLGALAGRWLHTLSGGERQRAVLGRVLAQRPRLLLLDEPTAALDLGHAQQVLELVDRLRTEDGTTVVTTLHDLTLAGQYADELLLLAGGRKVAAGPPAAVLTEQLLAEHYGVSAQVQAGPDGVRIHPTRPGFRGGQW